LYLVYYYYFYTVPILLLTHTHAPWQLEEETGSLKKQLSVVKEELEGELEAAGKKAKEAAAKAAAETSEMSTKLGVFKTTEATSVCALKLLVYGALSYWCMRP
jgi:hypothetical protein